MTQPSAPMQFVTRAECDAALPDILSAPKDDAAIDTLCTRPALSERCFPDRIHVSVDRGIEGERWLHDPWLRLDTGQPDPRIQMSILPLRVANLCCNMAKDGFHPGDTIIADLDMSEANLPAGTRLQIGSAVVEVSDLFNTACVKWKKRYGVDSVKWINHAAHRPYRLRGVLCSIVKTGDISASDRIRVVR